MVSDEYKKIIRETSTEDLGNEIPALKEKTRVYASIVKEMEKLHGKAKLENAVFEEICDLYKDYKDKLFFCTRIYKARKIKETTDGQTL